MIASPRYFTKHFADPARCAAARRHYVWIAAHAPILLQPTLVAAGPTSLTFDYIDGRHAEPRDLPQLAAMLGYAHGDAWTYDLRRARLDRPHPLADGADLPDYLTGRRQTLKRRLAQGHIADRVTLETLLSILERTADGPVAFYKDVNPRNVLITTTSVYTVDVDDLTLAPFGYDLAKLVHTLALSHGPLLPDAVCDAVQRYNTAARRQDQRLGDLTTARLDDFLLLHRALTAPYAGRDHYRGGHPQPLTREAR